MKAEKRRIRRGIKSVDIFEQAEKRYRWVVQTIATVECLWDLSNPVILRFYDQLYEEASSAGQLLSFDEVMQIAREESDAARVRYGIEQSEPATESTPPPFCSCGTAMTFVEKADRHCSGFHCFKCEVSPANEETSVSGL